MPNACVTCAVNVTPKSGKDQVMGVSVADDGTCEVRVRVTAPPDNGKANKAVCKLMASTLGISKSAVTIKRGETSHHKMLELAMDPAAYQAWYDALPRV
jgi:uncharacterized protein